jgi:hypothetical protein
VTVTATAPGPAVGLALAGALALLAPACTVRFEETVRGTGVSASEVRAVDPFERVEAEDRLELVVEVGAGPLVTVHGDENLLPYVVVEVRGERLVVEVLDGYQLEPPPRVEVQAPRLAGFAGTGLVSARLVGVDAPELDLALVGSGDVEASGRAGRVRLESTGSGDVDLSHLVAVEAEVRATGSGDVRVHATERLVVRAVGSGEVVYRGEPRVDAKRLGSGSVRAER